MKILALNGSPKNNGASATIMSALNAKLAAQGHGVKRYDLNSLEMRGCQECYVCKKKRRFRLSCGLPLISRCPGHEIQSAKVKQDSHPESLPAPEPARLFFDPLDSAIPCFGHRV